MHLLLSFCLGLFLLTLSFAEVANAKETTMEDLASPEVSAMHEQTEDNQLLTKGAEREMNIDELLGPKDSFPFLPDNHRDSGTGKFNSF